ncbi:Asr1405/Asl0597 family protein [Stenomitos frigidus]|uniref:Uncharacterized protein n=1 Tax=Stenomitos frigidus ULC18 TaxID=2107698 RepID=A0A2T1DTH7_9CYAN|nr:Asr1405/Asl0597 family protein [Stenomitos frigidus]PSB23797.1 hypothetical protein C7B82_30175 [Stenomitos frigidus ULC18]
MSPRSPANSGTSQINDPLTIKASVAHIVAVPRIDRWRIYHRLQEPMIPCWCLDDMTNTAKDDINGRTYI